MHPFFVFLCPLLLFSSAQARHVRRDASNLGAGSVTSAKSSTAHVGEFILAGIGVAASTPSSTTSSASLVTPSRSLLSSRTTPSISTISRPPSLSSAVVTSQASFTTFNGSGPQYALSCYESLWDWYGPYEDYLYEHGEMPSSDYSLYWYTLTSLLNVTASRFTTSCDGYPRVIGSATILSSSSYEYYWLTAPSLLTPTLSTPYPTPIPCTIGTSDCASLDSILNSYPTKWLGEHQGQNTTLTWLLAPCTTAATDVSTLPFTVMEYNGFGSTITVGPTTDNCLTYSGHPELTPTFFAYASAAQLLYWPVLRQDVSSKNNSICSGKDRADRTRAVPNGFETDMIPWITGTPTGSGPNTFVTGTLTITSPDVAIVFTSLSLGNYLTACGTTIQETVITLPVEAVSSQRGARVNFGWYPFDFSDLNWVCQSGNSSVFTTQFEPGPNCYQDVPAIAYFNANDRYDSYTSYTDSLRTNTDMVDKLTIANDYHPNIIPKRGYLTDWLYTVLGAHAEYGPNGRCPKTQTSVHVLTISFPSNRCLGSAIRLKSRLGRSQCSASYSCPNYRPCDNNATDHTSESCSTEHRTGTTHRFFSAHDDNNNSPSRGRVFYK